MEVKAFISRILIKEGRGLTKEGIENSSKNDQRFLRNSEGIWAIFYGEEISRRNMIKGKIHITAMERGVIYCSPHSVKMRKGSAR